MLVCAVSALALPVTSWVLLRPTKRRTADTNAVFFAVGSVRPSAVDRIHLSVTAVAVRDARANPGRRRPHALRLSSVGRFPVKGSTHSLPFGVIETWTLRPGCVGPQELPALIECGSLSHEGICVPPGWQSQGSRIHS